MCELKSVLIVALCMGFVASDTAPYSPAQSKQALSVESSPYPSQAEIQYAPVADEKEKNYVANPQVKGF